LLEQTEHILRIGIDSLRLLVEALSALIIAIGVGVAIFGLVRHFLKGRGSGFNPVRLAFARYLMLALEFLLAADILATVISPTWDQLSQLAVIAIIRIALNYFLGKEMQAEEARQDQDQKKADQQAEPQADAPERA
jgi:uncharacterized membrane protein